MYAFVYLYYTSGVLICINIYVDECIDVSKRVNESVPDMCIYIWQCVKTLYPGWTSK